MINSLLRRFVAFPVRLDRMTANVDAITLATGEIDFHQAMQISHSHGYSIACGHFRVSQGDLGGSMRGTY
ncbi:hypothetical protein L6654_16960 [Bradyrhizobium sp. WYCCWR 13023]|uniref:Uncharacterized protein n=1 Tax=Bradyrhizobium zhengyangense TaxID=2911009 RepID=A0A9X1R8R5_9BRAD|nr:MULTISPECIES: hypothetical protein [Bradyrhizobium]MCG2628324.1 hypothetical protein [Bradyrhizobium zhengyangense]MCG2640280.1 hypothetical protein [Bradyrhizobium zhengyangense]MCG2665562.1 hypothetical protein [Bradyrhizobium zhengyangense]